MENRRPISPKTLLALVVGGAFVLAGVVMILVGWPEREAWQTLLLEMSGVMFALAVATAIWRMVSERELMRRPTPSFRIVRAVTLVAIAAALVVYGIALTTRDLDLAPLAQFFLWVGLGAMFSYLAAGAIRRELTDRATWDEVEDADPDATGDLDLIDDLGRDADDPRRAATAVD